ncbi:MAG TPA: hypothetical protein VFB69_03955 [Candidatus Dormibacteraeota bacterium]|nr:hypothetical protein [Candidatus Dormibacteraeota bacterium]
MASDLDRWTINHFAQANPKGEGQDDVAALLERVAETIRSLGAIHVQDITFHDEIDDDGQAAVSLTVYYHRDQ